ncbi:MAG: hypothetical protein HQK77_22490, partial [Desulfobacterales bacterium]|nr:hypothetical protein [Desulfobacterales bacterium]
TARKRYTIIDSLSRNIDDMVHEVGFQFLLDNMNEEEGERINTFISHAVNDLVMSNNAIWEDTVDELFKELLNNSCDMGDLIDVLSDFKLDSALKKLDAKLQARTSKDDWETEPINTSQGTFEGGGATNINKLEDLWYDMVYSISAGIIVAKYKLLVDAVVPFVYNLFYDLNNNEYLTLCFKSFSIGGSDLKLSFGDSWEEFFKIQGGIKNVRLAFEFKHTTDSWCRSGAQYFTMESGTLVINFSEISLEMLMKDPDTTDTTFKPVIEMKKVAASGISAWWENWVEDSLWCELSNNSGVYKIAEMINDKFKSFEQTEFDTPAETEKSETDPNDPKATLTPGSDIFVMGMDVENTMPETTSTAYTSQEKYYSSSTTALKIHPGHRELGFAMNDDVINQMMLFSVLEGKLFKDKEKVILNQTVHYVLNTDVAPIVSFNVEEEKALRFDLANCSLVLSIPDMPEPMEYRLDISAVMSLYVAPSVGAVNFIVDQTDITAVPIRGPKAPDAVIEAISNDTITGIVDLLDEKFSTLITGMIDKLLKALPVNICIEISQIGAIGSGNFLSGSIDLSWSDEISTTDSCFNLSSTWPPVEPDLPRLEIWNSSTGQKLTSLKIDLAVSTVEELDLFTKYYDSTGAVTIDPSGVTWSVESLDGSDPNVITIDSNGTLYLDYDYSSTMPMIYVAT